MQRGKEKAPNLLGGGSGLNVEITNEKGINMSNNTTQGGKNQGSKNSVATAGQQQSMTSREIAELCEKEHKHVMRDAKVMLVQLGLPEEGYAQTWTHPQNGQSYPVFMLPKDLTLTLVSGYNVVMRKRIIDRWLELDAAPASVSVVDPMQVLNDPAAMRGLLLGYTEKVLKLEEKVQTLAPKAEALDRIATADGSLCIRDAAKTLQMQEGKLVKCLIEKKWLYQRPMGTGKLAYSDKIQLGFLEHKITQGNKPDGSEWVSTQARITAKGLAHLSKMLTSSEGRA